MSFSINRLNPFTSSLRKPNILLFDSPTTRDTNVARYDVYGWNGYKLITFSLSSEAFVASLSITLSTKVLTLGTSIKFF